MSNSVHTLTFKRLVFISAFWVSLLMRGATAQSRGFAIVGPSSWNDLPVRLELLTRVRSSRRSWASRSWASSPFSETPEDYLVFSNRDINNSIRRPLEAGIHLFANDSTDLGRKRHWISEWRYINVQLQLQLQLQKYLHNSVHTCLYTSLLTYLPTFYVFLAEVRLKETPNEYLKISITFFPLNIGAVLTFK